MRPPLPGCSVLAALSAGQGRELVLLFGQFPVPLEEGEAIPTGAYASDSGRWMKDVPLWLAVEHDGERILSLRALSAPRAVPPSAPLLQSLLDVPADPFSAPPGGWRDAENRPRPGGGGQPPPRKKQQRPAGASRLRAFPFPFVI